MSSTYTTSLKIQEIGNGEQSGIWGSTTNTNWTLIEQAVAGVQTVTMANSNRTLTDLNGLLDEARNMVLIINGTNSGIYQVVAPLVSKLYVISNQTTGGYAITIGASSGSIVTIPNGVTVQVYCDGVTGFYYAQTGSAGNFIVNGTLTATGVTDTGNMSVSGTLTTSNDASISGLTVGKGGGSVGSNSAFGLSALLANTTGASSTAVGYQASATNTTGANLTAVGYQALVNNTTASNNTAVGYQAGYSNTTGTDLVAIGYQAGYGNSTGNYNTAVGRSSLQSNSTGFSNSAFGYASLISNSTGTNNTGLGFQSLNYNSTASNNTAVGYQAGYYITTGAKNTILGGFNGNQGGLDIRTSSNNIVLSDGDGNPRVVCDSNGIVTGQSGNLMLVSGTAQASTSGTSIDFTGIPSWVKRITVMFNGVSTNGTSAVRIQLGSGSAQTTGYVTCFQAGTTGYGPTSAGFDISAFISASDTRYGVISFVLITGNNWVGSGIFSQGTNLAGISTGSVALSGILDRVRITTVNGTDTFDAGSINILYE
jgi:hypothetical protein